MGKNRLDDIVAYFTDMFHLGKDYDLPVAVVNTLNDIDRAERGELKSRLFNEAKRIGQGSDGVKAIRWLENAFDQIEKYSFRMHEVLFSPGQDIPENLAFHLSRAKKSIDLCVFTISDELLGKCIKNAHQKGIKVRIITDGNKMRDTGSQIKDLARAGIEVKVDNSKYHMHNKFGLIDGRIAFTGSYNWTYTAKAYNQENLLLTTNYTIVHSFIQEFEQLWDEMFWLKVKQRKDGRLQATVNVNGHIVPAPTDFVHSDDDEVDTISVIQQCNNSMTSTDYSESVSHTTPRPADDNNRRREKPRFKSKSRIPEDMMTPRQRRHSKRKEKRNKRGFN